MARKTCQLPNNTEAAPKKEPYCFVQKQEHAHCSLSSPRQTQSQVVPERLPTHSNGGTASIVLNYCKIVLASTNKTIRRRLLLVNIDTIRVLIPPQNGYVVEDGCGNHNFSGTCILAA